MLLESDKVTKRDSQLAPSRVLYDVLVLDAGLRQSLATVRSLGGLTEAVDGYDGAILVPPADSTALQSALLQAAKLRGIRYADPRLWEHTAAHYHALFDAIC